MTRRLGAALLPLLLLAALAAPVRSTAAAEGIEVRSSTSQNRFPQGVQFTVFLASNADITSVRLKSRVLPDGVDVTTRPQCTSGSVINCTATIGGSAASYMVPGAEIVYYWEADDAAGASLRTPEARATYMDDRFPWESLADGNITVYTYSGTDESVRSVLRTARETVDRFSALEKTQLDFPVKVWVYQTARDMAPATGNANNGRGVTTLGEVGASDTALVSRDTAFLDTVRHELQHVVMRRATRGFIVDIPRWINEGTSVYAQRQMLADQQQALDLAVRRNRTIPLTSLNSAGGTGDTVGLFYAQSGSVIRFLVETYGDDKFGDFIAAHRSDTSENALKAVYGFDMLGLENQWRRAMGMPAVSDTGGDTGGSSSNERGIPTIVPFGAGGSSSGPAATSVPNNASPDSDSAASSGGGSSSLPLIAGGVLLLVVLLGGGGGFLVLKRKS